MTVALWKRDALEVTDGEGAVLGDLARLVPAHLSIVEIGSYRGRSTCFLAAGAAEGAKAPIFAVDLWTDGPGYAVVEPGSRLDRPYAEPSTREAFDVAVAEHGHGLVTARQGASIEVARKFDRPIGLLFVDGSHAHEDVLADIRAWTPKVWPRGFVVFHDYQAPSVSSAVDGTLGAAPLLWQPEPGAEKRLGIFRRLR